MTGLGLNPLQERAVLYTGGPLLVLAGPGTGKTRVLTQRIINLIKSGRARPEDILAITFTNQAAGEISKRVKEGLGEKGTCDQISQQAPYITTFHSWALNFLRSELGKDARLPIDEEEATFLFHEALKNIPAASSKKNRLLSRISLAKQHYPPLAEDDPLFVEAYKSYEALLGLHGLWDYDDLILEAIRLLTIPDIREKFRCSRPYVLVDEFQDVSPAQYELLRLMAHEMGEITVIGDPNQAIYGFRGASPEFLDRFQRDFSNVCVIRLDTAYRCPQVFLDAAGAVISEERSRCALTSEKGKGPLITTREFSSQEGEASWIAKTIEKMAGGLSFESVHGGCKGEDGLRSLSDFAILFRTNHLAKVVADKLSRAGIPFQRSMRETLLSDPEVRLVYHLWEASRGRNIDYHLKRIHDYDPRHEKKVQEGLPELKGLRGENLLDSIVELLDISLNAPKIRALKNIVLRYGAVDCLPLILRHEADGMEVNIEAVSLLSLHASKGLEFPVVFIIGCEAGILPWEGSDLREEERLFYVGITRASERLFLSYVRSRKFFGKKLPGKGSPFLSKIPRDLVEQEKSTVKKKKKNIRPKQKTLF